MTMAKVSYANAAASAAPSFTNGHRRLLTSELFSPPTETFTLLAALFLLEQPKNFVYLVPRDYLENWVHWAWAQPVPPYETERLRKALKLVAEAHEFNLQSSNAEYHDPGPMDSRDLSIPGHALLLRPDVQVGEPQSAFLPTALKRVLSLNAVSNQPTNPADENGESDKVQCCVVQERFYELLRSCHGVCCDDNISVSHQRETDYGYILHHHRWNAATPDTHDLNWRPRPVEFRRPVLYVHETTDATRLLSPASKLLQEATSSHFVPTVEAFPIKLVYRVTDGTSVNGEKEGFLLVSKETKVLDAIPAIRKAVAPRKSSDCVRIWSKMENSRPDGTRATVKGDGFELVHIDYRLDGQLVPVADDVEYIPSEMTIGEWVNRHCNSKDDSESLDILVETRASPTSKWARDELEFYNRLEVGDFVDAQDNAGNWYEAIVRATTDETVTVHYAGWASRWDSTVHRRPDQSEPGISDSISPPAPLWSHSSRWREQVKEGEQIEIRQVRSNYDRPKWYRGIIRKVGGEKDAVRDMTGGATLEATESDDCEENGNRRPLLVLNRTQQVLVECPSEKFDSVSTATQNDGKKDYCAEPPYIRWVSLYGEEICKQGTHLKVKKESSGPTTVSYDYDERRGQPVEIMKSWNGIHGAGFIRESIRGIPPAPGACGLQNLGNSCFLNSVVQCMNHTEPLKNYFLSGKYTEEINNKNPLGSGGQVAVAYGSLLQEIWGGEFRVIAPRLLKKTIASFAPQFNNLYQHDSHEFCSFLMDGIHEDLNRVQEKPWVEELEGFGMPDKQAAIESWKKHLLRHDSIIVDHCQGMHRSHVTCPICGRESIKFDVYSSISLPLSREKDSSTIPLEECLEKFAEGEQLDEHNAWYCPNCKKHVCALKMIALWSVPDILILHLKRFTFNHCHISGNVIRDKMEDKVVFPIDRLDMRPYILGPIDEDAPPVYKLFGVSEHSGATANSGHYTATVRNSQDGHWYRYNDSHVGSSSGDASVTGGAYLLFYQREKNTSRWAGMEKVIENEGKPEVDVDGFTEVKVKTKKKKKGGGRF